MFPVQISTNQFNIMIPFFLLPEMSENTSKWSSDERLFPNFCIFSKMGGNRLNVEAVVCNQSSCFVRIRATIEISHTFKILYQWLCLNFIFIKP